jgi:hypothetical protein
VKYYIIADAEKQTFELYELKDEKYLRMEIDFNTAIDFSLDEECTVSVLLNDVWD